MASPLPASLVLLSLAATAATQDSRPAWQDTLAKLRSTEPAERAWGAWLAVQGGHVQAGPELVRILGSLAEGADTGDQEFELRSVLDAVVQLAPRVPPETLAPWLRRDRLQTAALVSALRAPRDYAPQLLALIEGKVHETTWIPVTGALLHGDPHGVLGHLLVAARTSVEITVRDPGSFTGSLGGSMTGRGCGTIEAPAGFPPTVLYSLEFTDRGGTVLIQGPTPVWYRREVHAERSFGVGGSTPQLDRADHALACLHGLAGLPPSLRLPSRKKIAIAWDGGPQYLADVTRELDPLKSHWQETLRSLVGRKLLGSDQLMKLPPPLDVEVKDQRQSRGTPLPELPRASR